MNFEPPEQRGCHLCYAFQVCYVHPDEGLLTDQCEEDHHLIHDYSVM